MNANDRSEEVQSSEEQGNSQCLDGMRCPRCGSFEPFTIYGITGNAVVYDAGTEEVTGIEWDDAECLCQRCDFRARVRVFKKESIYRCDNCAADYRGFGGLRPVTEYGQDSGDPKPSRECPACRALCYLDAPEAPPGRGYRVTVLAAAKDPEQAPIRLGTAAVDAADAQAARRLGVEQPWDPRRDAAGCSPAAVVWQEVRS